MRYPPTLKLISLTITASLLVAPATTIADGQGGVRNGSFAEASNGDWQYTEYILSGYDFQVDILNEPGTGRNAFIRLDLARFGGSGDAFPEEKPVLFQEDIQLADCRDSSVFILQFDYRATAVTGFYALRAELTARDAKNNETSVSSRLLGMDEDQVGGDVYLGWSTAQLALELPGETDPSSLTFDVEFEVLFWGADTAQPVCGVAFPVVDLDQVSLSAAASAGDAVPDSAQFCGDAWAAQTIADTIDVPLVTEEVTEQAVDPIYRHRIVDPLGVIECGPGGWPETPCLFHLPTVGVSYDPAEEVCQADFNGDGLVSGADLTILLGDWGTTDSIADLDCSGLVDGGDLTMVLGDWGFCVQTQGLIAPPNL